MASFGVSADQTKLAPAFVTGASHEEERAYWDTPKRPQKTHQTQAPQRGGVLSNVPGLEAGFTLVSDVGTLAKTLGEQANEGTAKIASESLGAYKRFTAKIVSAADGGGGKLESKEDSAGEGNRTGHLNPESNQDREEEEEGGGGAPGSEDNAAVASDESSSFQAQSFSQLAALTLRGQRFRDTVKGAVGESTAVAAGVIAMLEKKPVDDGDDKAGPGGGGGKDEGGASIATLPLASASSVSGGPECSETKAILPRTSSLVGGRSWSVLTVVYETAAAVVDESLGDLVS